MRAAGFSLVELMIALVLGLILSGAIVQVMVGNEVTNTLNRSLATVQESGRFFVTRMRTDLMTVGRYDKLDPNLSRLVDVVEEQNFVTNRPVLLPGDFVSAVGVGSQQGASGGNDVLVVGFQGTHDCRGYTLGYADDEEFFVVNEYFIDDGALKCRGYDGRVLRGQKSAVGHNNNAAFTLLDGVEGFQVLYGVNGTDTDASGRPNQYVNANQIAALRDEGANVVALRLAVLLQGTNEIQLDAVPTYQLLNEPVVTPSEPFLYRPFETTIALRNVKNDLESKQ